MNRRTRAERFGCSRLFRAFPVTRAVRLIWQTLLLKLNLIVAVWCPVSRFADSFDASCVIDLGEWRVVMLLATQPARRHDLNSLAMTLPTLTLIAGRELSETCEWGILAIHWVSTVFGEFQIDRKPSRSAEQYRPPDTAVWGITKPRYLSRCR